MRERSPGPGRPSALERLCLHTRATRSWALYDWANSAFVTTVVAAVFPVYYERVVAAGLPADRGAFYFALATTLSLFAIAVSTPLLGALADVRGARKRFLSLFLGLAVLATAGLFAVGPGDVGLALTLFSLANVGAAGSVVFYDALLPHVAPPGRQDQLSTSGYALGYLGGGLLLSANLAWIAHPEWFGLPAGEGLSAGDATLPTRLAFLSVALWWAVFSLPLLLGVREPARALESDEEAADVSVCAAASRLGETASALRGYRPAFTMLVAFLLYNDGIATIIRMAVFLGAQRGFGESSLIAAIVMVQFIGIPFALLFGRLAERFGSKPLIAAGIAVYFAITAAAVGMQTELHFFGLAVAVAMVQGGTQALSRSLFASLIPAHKSSEFFALFGVLEKFAGVAGPALFTLAVALLPASRAEYAILTILPFFAAGLYLLFRVDVEGGRASAREIEANLREPGVTHSPGL